MNPMVSVVKRNIASLIRRGISVKLGHPMDSGGLVNTPGGQQSEMDSTAPDHPHRAASIMEPAEDEGAASMEIPKPTSDQPVSQEKKKPRQFDFSMWNRRRIALKLAYLGWDYHGLAIQEPHQPTIESCLFECLQKTKLIADSRSCHYSRCGRTDKGVSAFGQVISLEVRSNLLEGDGVIVPEGSKAASRNGDKTSELPYMVMLNNNLPSDMRVLSWATVDQSFSARFSCLQRTYKYFFPRGEMNLDVMRDSAQQFLGEHDFRNFCKMDINGGVTNYRRTVLSFSINPLDNGPPSPYQMCEMTIVGRAFLMHQVRCMAAVLFLIGNGLEQPSLINHMLDLEHCPRKPQYGMAAAEPLILYDCEFEGLEWECDQRSYEKVVAHFQSLWTTRMVQAVMIRSMLGSLELSIPSSASSSQEQLLPSSSPVAVCRQMASIMQSDHKLGQKSYKPLLKRPTSNSFEERYEHHRVKKRKLAVEDPAQEKGEDKAMETKSVLSSANS